MKKLSILNTGSAGTVLGRSFPSGHTIPKGVKKKKVQMVCDISKRSKSTKALKFLLDSALGRVCPDFVHD